MESKTPQGNRKQIAFDLSQKALEQYYPGPPSTINPQFYKKAYADISRFMEKNGFEHRQFSVYISKERMTNAKMATLIQDLAREMPWLAHCIEEMDVTNIGVQHSLRDLLIHATELQIEAPQQEHTQVEIEPTTEQPSIGARLEHYDSLLRSTEARPKPTKHKRRDEWER